jgi:protein adenylyltransferase
MSTVFSKLPLQCLPLPPVSHTLIHNLTPDPVTPDPATFHGRVLHTEPSVQRRTRLLDEAAHYSHVSPLPLEFPYHIEVDENSEISDRSKAIETWLAEKEPLNEVDIGPSTLKAYSSDKSIKEYHLVGIAPRGLKDCVPALDVGDAFEHIGVPSLTTNSEVSKPADLVNGGPQEANNASSYEHSSPTCIREVLTDILSGHTVLFDPSKEKGYAPWSLRYSGHQFGSWAGQLGDGRAISIRQSILP